MPYNLSIKPLYSHVKGLDEYIQEELQRHYLPESYIPLLDKITLRPQSRLDKAALELPGRGWDVIHFFQEKLKI